MRCGKIRDQWSSALHRIFVLICNSSISSPVCSQREKRQKTSDRKSKYKSKESKWEREGWCGERCHWCESSMEGSQTLEAIFTSSASSDRLPSALLRRISTAHSLTHTSLFLHSVPARSRYCSSKSPNNMLFFQSWKSVSLAWWSWKRHQMAVLSVPQRVRNMFCCESGAKSKQIQNTIRVFWRTPQQTSSECEV